MGVLAAGLRFVDLRYRGLAGVIATGVLDTPDGLLLVDPGPAICLPTLDAQLAALGTSRAEVTGLLLTHIHLDHAGASGVIVRDNPRIRVYVHQRGAPHLADPSKLLASARRLYPDMDAIWGPFLPVPSDRLRVLTGGERLAFGSRTVEVLYTPGHASHHVSYLERETGVAFVGDVGGARLPGSAIVVAPTPPPDIDVELWRDSIARLTAWRPSTLLLSHFGPAGDPPTVHLQKLEEQLSRSAARVRRLLEQDGSDDEKLARYVEEFTADLRREGGDAEGRYAVVMPLDQCWQGLVRYWTKKGTGTILRNP